MCPLICLAMKSKLILCCFGSRERKMCTFCVSQLIADLANISISISISFENKSNLSK